MNDFVWEERVHIYDTDAQGVVHYAGYYRFFTDAFEQFSRSRLDSEFPILNEKVWFVVVESKATYHKPARLGERLRTHVGVELSGKRALRFKFNIYHDGELVCEGSIVQVAINSKRWKSINLPRSLVAKVKMLSEK